MSSTEDFLSRAEKDQEFAKNNCESTCPVWAIVIYGYAAINYVRAVLKRWGWDPKNHKERRLYLNRMPQLKEFAPEYDYIYKRCWNGRYEPLWEPSSEEIDTVKDNLSLIARKVKSILSLPP